MAAGRKDPEAGRRIGGNEGQTLAEYSLILLLVALVCIAAVTLLGVPIQGFYTGFNGSF